MPSTSFTTSSLVLALVAILCVENTIAIPMYMDSSLEIRTSEDELKAAELKKSNYRKTGLDANAPGAFTAGAGGSTVHWDSKAKGDAEHVVEPGAHLTGPLNDAGLGKDHALTKDIKDIANSGDNLSMLQSGPNIAKGKIAANPDAHVKHADAAKDYMAKPEVQDKAKVTVDKIKDAADKHGHPEVGIAVQEKVAAVIPAVKPPSRPSTPTSGKKRALDAVMQYARSLEQLLDELD